MRDDWHNLTMLEACDLITCGVAARPNYVDDGIPFLSAKNVKEGKILYTDFNSISLETHLELTKKNKPLPGDILYTRVGSYGEAAVIEKNIEFSVFVSLTLIKPKKKLLDSHFLRYYLNSHEIKTLAKKSITSSGVGNLNVGTVRKFPVKIPPIQEQKEIVEILDQAFNSIEKAKVNIEKNIQNAKELFQSKLNQIFSQTGEDVEFKKWKEVIDIRSGRSQKEVEDPNGKYPILGSAGKIMSYANKFICEKNTTIIGRKGTINSPKFIEERFWNVDTAFGLHALSELYNKFLFMFCLSYDFTQRDKGSGRPSLVKSDLYEIIMPIPPIEKQKEITETLDILDNHIQSLLVSYEEELKNLEELKKSILQKAFEGELTNKSVTV